MESTKLSPDEEIVIRFFEVLDYLIRQEEIRSYNAFRVAVGANKGVLQKLKADPSRSLFRASWISYLYKYHLANPLYILVGEGKKII